MEVIMHVERKTKHEKLLRVHKEILISVDESYSYVPYLGAEKTDMDPP
jgi:hypothetical protein